MERKFNYDRGLFKLQSTELKTQVRAVAFSICIKMKVCCPILKDSSFKKLSEMTGLTEFQCKVHFDNLAQMGLLTLSEMNGHNYWKFESLKAKKIETNKRFIDRKSGKTIIVKYNPNERNDSVIIDNTMDYDEIVKALYASIIRNSSLQRLYFVNEAKAADIESAKTINEVRLAKFLIKQKGSEFYQKIKSMDLGMSYSFLCEKLKVNVRELSEIIKFGEKHNYFVRLQRRIRHKVGEKFARLWYEGLDDFGCQFAKGDSIYQQESNVYYPVYGKGILYDLAREMYDKDLMLYY